MAVDLSRSRNQIFDWYEESKPPREAARLMVEACKAIAGHNKSRQAQEMTFLRLYSDREWRYRNGLDNRASALHELASRQKPGVSINVIRNAINSSVSMLAGGKPVPFCMTDGADWMLQKKARQRTRFLQGLVHRQKVHVKNQYLAQQGCIFGNGYYQINRTKNGPEIEEVFSPEILVDEFEGIYRRPPNVYRVRSVDRALAKVWFPDKADLIDKAPQARISSTGPTSDRIDIFIGWHVASEIGADDGCYMMVLDAGETKGDGMLCRRPYKWTSPPLVRWAWNEEPIGWHGSGIPSEGKSLQFEINTLMRLVQQNMWSGGNLKVLLERGSRIVKSQVSNSLRAPMIEYTGTPPIFTAPQTVDPSILNHIQWLIESFYNQLGISQMNAMSQTPFASMSGKARMVADTKENQRFLATQRRFDSAVTVDLSDRLLEAAADIKEQFGDFEVVFAGRSTVEPIRYSDITGHDEEIDIRTFSTSGLASTPAGRMAEIERYADRGLISPEEEILYAELPETGALTDGIRASYENVQERLWKIMSEGVSVEPDDSLDLNVALKIANQHINRAELMLAHKDEDRRPDKANVQLLRDWRDLVVELIEKQTEPPPVEAGMGAPVDPTAPPMGPADMPPGMPMGSAVAA